MFNFILRAFIFVLIASACYLANNEYISARLLQKYGAEISTAILLKHIQVTKNDKGRPVNFYLFGVSIKELGVLGTRDIYVNKDFYEKMSVGNQIKVMIDTDPKAFVKAVSSESEPPGIELFALSATLLTLYLGLWAYLSIWPNAFDRFKKKPNY